MSPWLRVIVLCPQLPFIASAVIVSTVTCYCISCHCVHMTCHVHSYLGRKRLEKDKERLVEGSDRLAWPHYSYWTLSYALSNAGAHKLLAQKPLTKMVPVDEFLPIMFDRHTESVACVCVWGEGCFLYVCGLGCLDTACSVMMSVSTPSLPPSCLQCPDVCVYPLPPTPHL